MVLLMDWIGLDRIGLDGMAWHGIASNRIDGRAFCFSLVPTRGGEEGKAQYSTDIMSFHHNSYTFKLEVYFL